MLGRPYPRVVAGTPVSWSFDPATGRFELIYTTRKASHRGHFRRGISEVSLPRFEYRTGYRASAGALSKRNAKVLQLRSRRHHTTVTVLVKPR